MMDPMNNASNAGDSMEFLRKMWANMGVPVPGMVVPTLDVNELEKRVTDLKAVEGWLKMNLGMLQLHIQGLEMQRSTLVAMQNLGQTSEGANTHSAPNPFANPAMWPWAVMQQAASAAASASANASPDQDTTKD